MAAKPDLPPREYERLSAYLDGELSDSERAALEADLQAQPALQQELESLRQTVALIQELPPLQAPRNFTLTKDMVAQSAQARIAQVPRRSIINVWSVAAAMFVIVIGAALLLVLAGSQTANFQSAAENVAAAPTQISTVQPVTKTEDNTQQDDRLRTENTQPQALDEADSNDAEIAADADRQPAENAPNAPPAPGAIADTGIGATEAEPGDAPLSEEPALQFAYGEAGEDAASITDGFPAQSQVDDLASEPGAGGGFVDDATLMTPEGFMLEVVSPTTLPEPSAASEEESIESEDQAVPADNALLTATSEANVLLQIEATATALSRIPLATPTTETGRLDGDGERQQQASDSSGLLVIGAGMIAILLIASFVLLQRWSRS